MAETPSWTTACPDWADRIVAGRSLISFAPLFPHSAEQALAVMRTLCIVDVAGKPTVGEVGRQWMFDFAAAIFGAYDEDSGRQLINNALLLISKKNWKSGLAASIMLTVLVLNWRDSAEFLILAPTVETAGNSFGPAADMVRASPELRRLLHVSPHHRTIKHRTTGATLKVVAADSDTVSGKKATAVLVEELWAFGKKPHAEAMLLEATGGLAARPEGFVIYISTMSDEAPQGVFKQKLAYFRGVRDGKIQDPHALPVLYEWPDEMLQAKAYENPDLWGLTNPNLGASVDMRFLVQKHREAEEAGTASLRGFYAKHLNVEVDFALREGGWAGARFWQQCADPTLTLEALLERSEVIVAGVDGGGADDLLGLALLGRERGTRRWLLWVKAWALRSVLELRKSEATRLEGFEDDGDLVLVDDLAEANQQLAAVVEEVRDRGLLHLVAADLYGTTDPVDALAQVDIAGEKQVVGIQQGWRLNGTVKSFETRLANRTLVHGAQPLMGWCVTNAKAVLKGNAVAIEKAVSGVGKIDPLVAGFCAGAVMVRNPPAQGASVYETRGISIL
jgi:phage terminase large subunit-like protein